MNPRLVNYLPFGFCRIIAAFYALVRLFLKEIAIHGRRITKHFPKGARKMSRIEHADFKANFLHAQMACFKQIPRGFHAL